MELLIHYVLAPFFGLAFIHHNDFKIHLCCCCVIDSILHFIADDSSIVWTYHSLTVCQMSSIYWHLFF